MAEEKVGLISRVVVEGAWGPKEYGIILTNERSIFVPESSSRTSSGSLVEGAVGVAVSKSMQKYKSESPEEENIEELTADDNNIAIPHSTIRKLRLKKGLSTYTFLVEYWTAGGKLKKLRATVTPPPEFIRKMKNEGLNSKEAILDYAKKIQVAYEKALPIRTLQRAKWGLK